MRHNNRHSFAFEQEAVEKYLGEKIIDRDNPFRGIKENKEEPKRDEKRYWQTSKWIQNNHYQPNKEKRRQSDRSDQFQRDKSLDETSKQLAEVRLRQREAFLQRSMPEVGSLLRNNEVHRNTGHSSARLSLDSKTIDRERNNLFNVFKTEGIVSKVGSRTNSVKENEEVEVKAASMAGNTDTSRDQKINRKDIISPKETFEEETKVRINESRNMLEKSLTEEEESDEYIIAEGPYNDNLETNIEESNMKNKTSQESKPQKKEHKQEYSKRIDKMGSILASTDSINADIQTNETYHTKDESQSSEQNPASTIHSMTDMEHEDQTVIARNRNEMAEKDLYDAASETLSAVEKAGKALFLPIKPGTCEADTKDEEQAEENKTSANISETSSPIIEQIREIRQFVTDASEKYRTPASNQVTDEKELKCEGSEEVKNERVDDRTTGIFWADLVQIEECPDSDDASEDKHIELRRPLSIGQHQLYKIREREDNRRKSWMMNTLEDQKNSVGKRHSTSYFVDLL